MWDFKSNIKILFKTLIFKGNLQNPPCLYERVLGERRRLKPLSLSTVSFSRLAASKNQNSEKKMSLIAGSYERFIWGFKLKSLKNRDSFSLNPLFSFPSHLSAIKCAAVSGSAAVTGGSDDTIKIYDLSTSSEIGSLHHSSTITSLCFYTPTSSSTPFTFPRNLIAAADDGSVIIYDADPFIHLKTVKGVHKKGVNDLSVHPSGQLALTVGRDECFAMVNLVRGRRSFCCRLGKEASIVRFNESGDKFFMATDNKITVHISEDAKLIFELDNKKKILCAAPGSVRLSFFFYLFFFFFYKSLDVF